MQTIKPGDTIPVSGTIKVYDEVGVLSVSENFALWSITCRALQKRSGWSQNIAMTLDLSGTFVGEVSSLMSSTLMPGANVAIEVRIKDAAGVVITSEDVEVAVARAVAGVPL